MKVHGTERVKTTIDDDEVDRITTSYLKKHTDLGKDFYWTAFPWIDEDGMINQDGGLSGTEKIREATPTEFIIIQLINLIERETHQRQRNR